jgi:ATP synthase protein I
MAGDARNDSDRANSQAGTPPSDEAALSARLQRLDDRLSALRKDRDSQADQSQREGPKHSANASAMARAFRLSSELIAGVLVGAVIGWSIDHWLSTTPWGMIVFVLLGFAAGVLNVMRAAGVTQNDRGNG